MKKEKRRVQNALDPSFVCPLPLWGQGWGHKQEHTDWEPALARKVLLHQHGKVSYLHYLRQVVEFKVDRSQVEAASLNLTRNRMRGPFFVHISCFDLKLSLRIRIPAGIDEWQTCNKESIEKLLN